MKDKNPSFRYAKSIFYHATNSAGEKWRCYSGPNPVDPLIFHRLELEFPCLLHRRCRTFAAEEDDENRRLLRPLRHRWNKKLLFHLAQEIFAGDASASEGEVLARIEGLPAAAGDREGAEARRVLLRHPAVADEARELAREVGLEILDRLLADTAGELGEASHGIYFGEQQTHVTSRAPGPAAQRGGPTML